MARGTAFCLKFDLAIVRFGRNPQPIHIRGSTKPRHAAEPSKIRDANFIIPACRILRSRHCQSELARLS